MQPDSDDEKWAYAEHTKAKHAILIRYMKAWLSILGSGARAAGHRAELVIVDAFAGRGRYTSADPGSPLLLRDIAGQVVASRRADTIELFYIESDSRNCAHLTGELNSAEKLAGVVERGPFPDTFEKVAPNIINEITPSARSSFWFIDPFGYAGLPLTLIRRILTLPRSEVFVTLMVRDMNRFLDDRPHQQAIGRVLDLSGPDLAHAIDRVKQSSNRMRALRDLYVERLKDTPRSGGPRYVTFVQVAEDGPADTVYYLIHATSHPRGKHEMKEAIWEETHGLNAVYGTKDPIVLSTSVGQVDMFTGRQSAEMRVDYAALKRLLQSDFSGLRIEYENLQNRTALEHAFDSVTETHVKRALEELRNEGGVAVFRSNLPSARALAKGDVLKFPDQ